MSSPTTFQTLITSAPHLHDDLVLKRTDTTCGDLLGAYPNVQAPVCEGKTSICTFTRGLQGCCDGGNSCQFYTICVGYYDSTTCTDFECLECTSSAPNCIKYSFWDGESKENFDGYSCAIFPGTVTVYGSAASSSRALTDTTILLTTPISTSLIFSWTSVSSLAAASSSDLLSVAESKSSSSLTSISTSSPSPTQSSSSLSSSPASITTNSSTMVTNGTSASTTTSATEGPTPEPSSSSNTGVTVGGVLGGLAGLLLIGAASYFLYKKFWSSSTYAQHALMDEDVAEIQQNYNT